MMVRDNQFLGFSFVEAFTACPLLLPVHVDEKESGKVMDFLMQFPGIKISVPATVSF